MATVKVLTPVTVVLLPSTCFGANADVTKINFCCLIGINRNSKYFKYTVNNRKKYEAFLSLEGGTLVGKKIMANVLLKLLGLPPKVMVQLL